MLLVVDFQGIALSKLLLGEEKFYYSLWKANIPILLY